MFDPQLGVSLHTLSPDLNDTLIEQVAHSRIATLEVSARLFVTEQPNQATLPTLCVCPSSVVSRSPLFTSQIITLQSQDPLANRLPSGDQATLLTLPACPFIATF